MMHKDSSLRNNHCSFQPLAKTFSKCSLYTPVFHRNIAILWQPTVAK
jgi:hypothetical protein